MQLRIGFNVRLASPCARRTKAAVAWKAKDITRAPTAVPWFGKATGWQGSRVGSRVAVAAAADPIGDELFRVVDGIPARYRTPIFKIFWKLQAQASDEMTAKTEEAKCLALELLGTSNKLHKTERMLLRALSTAGVVNARSFLEYIAELWKKDTPGGPGKRQDIFKEGLRKRPDLVECLRRQVPSWVIADPEADPKEMEAKTVDNMASQIEAIIKSSNNAIHHFDTVTGLVLHRTGDNGPTVESLACIAQFMGVPYCIVEKKDDDDTRA
ncbi:hypothetical protein HXX76_011574 [Chlamydomonas incerta]|uniref:Uncharacterized protein n=1 Tax=Chlamydomonas incerta TaxID=51695 RepID=A0A835VUK1_CHLIN|nr:hypothetical protein HXX76_011574 [Chlamydomonas incerta]KAG2428455.1 hypothetical protein HXX76_011574 [Chlamydomonas incerta]|eukprot:KAG2428454.1 hypothetical protein HXX76_011574 [Chlamydomonas incerta]